MEARTGGEGREAEEMKTGDRRLRRFLLLLLQMLPPLNREAHVDVQRAEI